MQIVFIGQHAVVFACFSVAWSALCLGDITINYYQYQEESHNLQLPAERIIYAKLEALRDYVTARGKQKSRRTTLHLLVPSGYPGPAIHMHRKKRHSDVLWFIIIADTDVCVT